ncbi:pseudouridine synthase, partial [Enterococcus faecium]
KGIASKSMLAPLTKGIKIEGRKTSPAKFQILSVDPKTNHSIVELTIHERRNHQVKNMLPALGLPVPQLQREKYGELTLQVLRPGAYRVLNIQQVSSLL